MISTTRGNLKLKPGTLLQESIRVLPNNLTLKLGLDDTFDSNTTNQARQALQTVKRVTVLPLGQQELQYIFARMTEKRYQQLQKYKVVNLPPVGSFGLFLPSLDQIVTGSFYTANETITAAVQRLKSKFKSLLAARIVKQMLPNNTSQVKVAASMSIAGSKQIISETLPTRGIAKQTEANTTPAKPITIKDGEVSKLPVGTKIIFEIENKESTPIYVTVLVVDANGEMGIIFPNDWATSDDAALLAVGDKRIIPGDDDDFKLTIREPLGITEALIIASTSPLRTSLKVLKDIARRGNTTRGPIAPNDDEFLDIIDKLLEDVDTGTRRGITVKNAELATEVRGVDASKLAAMAINFEVVT